MILITRICIPILATLLVFLSAVTILLLVVAPGAFAPQTGFHWILVIWAISAAAFSLYSFFYLFFGSEPRNQVQVLISACAYLVLYLLLQSPAGGTFVRWVMH